MFPPIVLPRRSQRPPVRAFGRRLGGPPFRNRNNVETLNRGARVETGSVDSVGANRTSDASRSVRVLQAAQLGPPAWAAFHEWDAPWKTILNG